VSLGGFAPTQLKKLYFLGGGKLMKYFGGERGLSSTLPTNKWTSIKYGGIIYHCILVL